MDKTRFKSVLRTLRALIICTVLPLMLCGCSAERQLFALDTYIAFSVCGTRADAAAEACSKEIARAETLFSPTLATSDISKLNARAGHPVTIDADTAALIVRAKELSELTGGAYAPCVWPLTELWGFRDEPRVPEETDILSLLPVTQASAVITDGDTVTVPAGSGIDPGGIAKGYVSDRLRDILNDYGIKSALITLGGNVYAHGTKTDGSLWRVGIQDPFDASALIGTVACRDTAVITSGSYQRYFEQDGELYHHILDPETGRPANSGLVSVTVICPDGTKADALSTALFVMGEEKALAFWRETGGFSLVLVRNDGSVLFTEDAPFTPADGLNVTAVWKALSGNASSAAPEK